VRTPLFSIIRNALTSDGDGIIRRILYSAVIVLILIFFFIGVGSCAAEVFTTPDKSITLSSIERTPLPPDLAKPAGYYTDSDHGWIKAPATLEAGMRAFYNATGVRPYVYILRDGTTVSLRELKERAEVLYDRLFTDEAHFLLVFCDDKMGSYNFGYVAGVDAKTVMDEEAVSILRDYLDLYYHDQTVGREEMFSKAFEKTGIRIMGMEQTMNRLPVIIFFFAAALLLATAFLVMVIKEDTRKRLSAQKLKEQQEIEKLFAALPEKYSDQYVEDLARKYER